MTDYVFSPAENAFYLVALKDDYLSAGTWPSDGINIDAEDALVFMGEPPEGKVRDIGDDGLPCWVDLPPPTHEEQLAAADSEKQSRIDQANDYMNGKQWPGKAAIGRLKGDELAQYNLWLDYLDALEVVDTSSAPHIEWPTTPVEQAS
ncbi:tail fiber assembly protein [Escherichia coli]|uniref:tail fiber assembly protein n=1 Tax=Escherichia coli TaxID=562 RepID=UPI001C470D5C|nr:tail fiber assembly protein [Escherichia coli]EIE3104030.1 tail fiber assembly protein [Escherichia coli]MBV7159475.1 tail fiber assembly protein [Escherichia coli]